MPGLRTHVIQWFFIEMGVKLEIDFSKNFDIGSNNFLFQIHANCRIRRVYFSDRLYSEDELPAEFKLYLPMKNSNQNA